MSTCYSRNFRTIGRKTSIFERLTESYNFVRSAQGLLGMIFVAGKQFNVRSSINADPLPNTGIWIWWDNQMELEKGKYSTKDSLWGIVINVNKKYIKLNNYIIFSPFFFITQVHFHAYIECFWTLHHYLIQVYVILLIHYHLTSCLFVCLFSLFFLFFLFQQVVWVYHGKMKLSNSFFFFFFIPNDVGCQNPFQSVLLHLYLSSYIWACTCQYCQHHASFLWNRCLWLEEFNSQTEADSMIWQKFWKMLI